jgi:hypothetical protein
MLSKIGDRYCTKEIGIGGVEIRETCLCRLLMLIGHLYLSDMRLCVASRMDTKNVFKRDWTTCLEHDDHSRLNSQHNWGDLYDHLMSPRIFNLTTNQMFI